MLRKDGKNLMTPLMYKKINAFTSEFSSGNPAACIYLDANQVLKDSEMQNIAREHKGFVSEVVYCMPKSEISYALKYYSSECEVDFCGHGTIACMYDLIKNNSALNNLLEVSIETNKGKLTVYNELQTLDAVFISAPDPEFLTTDVDAAMAAEALGITASSISEEYPIRLVNAGLNTLIIPISTLAVELSVWPNEQSLKTFCLGYAVDIILVFTTDVTSQQNLVRTRVFAPKFGYLEDMATGSGNSALGYYMLRNDMWDGRPVSIEQNAEPSAYNIVRLKTIAGKVLFGGKATVKIEGNIFIK
ncbi:MAG: phenazine biosynthesis protein PhzF family [Firmicutes bacterium]|nr:phenazine biosynthesis protein PhzF family [Bacillota bacterium]